MPFPNPKARAAFFAEQNSNAVGKPFKGNSAPPMPTFSPEMKSAVPKQPAFQLGSVPKKPRFTQLTSMFKKGI